MSVRRSIRDSLADRRLTLVLRFAVGALLIWASQGRLLDPQPLADAIDDYRILPLAVVNVTAVTLPWVELIAGLCLIAGLGTPGAGLATAALAVVYTCAVSSALVRGLDIGCGCFGGGSETLSWSDLWLRLALFVAGVQITLAARFVDWPLMAVDRRARRSPGAT
jgi:uncharacterized membrane protein YphA (DoxX/SURF4 family)